MCCPTLLATTFSSGASKECSSQVRSSSRGRQNRPSKIEHEHYALPDSQLFGLPGMWHQKSFGLPKAKLNSDFYLIDSNALRAEVE